MKRKMKRRLCSLLLAFALLPAVAPAEVVGRDGMYADRYIHRIEAPNGQALYYLSTEEDAFVTARDVNFDGVDRPCCILMHGARATPGFCSLYGTGTRMCARPGTRARIRGLPNYELLPEDGLLLASCDDGLAGGLHRYWLYRWEGTGPAPCAQRGERNGPGNGD